VTTLAVSFDAFTQVDFWLGVGILAGIYAIIALGLQLNVGTTGILNIGQAGFMAIGAYSLGILVTKVDVSMWLAIPLGLAVAMLAAVLVGLPSLRLRADYFAIASVAFSEIVRYVAQNARGLTEGNQGITGFDAQWTEVADDLNEGVFAAVGLDEYFIAPLFVLCWVCFAVLLGLVVMLVRSPWGRALKAVREDEDAARAIGKNVLVYKLQSLQLAAVCAAIAGYLAALNLSFVTPQQFEPLVTFLAYAIIVIAGFGSYFGIAAATVVFWTLFEGTRFLDLPLEDEKVAALRFMVVGLLLIVLVALRPQGLFGKREEMVLGE
jgi:branched-chain amino acid transport system permease protein